MEKGKILFIPRGIHFTNYETVFMLRQLPMAVVVSVARTVLTTVLASVFSSYMAFLFIHQHMWCRKFIYRFVVITMYVSAGTIPQYLNIKMLGLFDSFWVYVIPGIFQVYNMVLAKTFMESLPASLEESAEIDGASLMRRFVSILLPLSLPILATIVLFIAVGQWNAYMDTLLYINDSSKYTLQFLLYQYLNQISALSANIEESIDISLMSTRVVTPTAVRMTITILVTLPILFVYPFIQRYYVTGMMVGAIKG